MAAAIPAGADRGDAPGPDAGPISDNERAYRFVRREIIEGRCGPGDRVVEARIADQLGISRTPVREAVRRLETEGLVVTEPNRGAQVRTLTDADVADLYGARARLEGFMSELAARRAQAEDIVRLRAAAHHFQAVVDQVDPTTVTGLREIVRANDRFHSGLVRAGRADQVVNVLAIAVDMPLVFGAFERYSPVDLRRSALFHDLIADAIEAREPERAGRLMAEHVLQGRDAHLGRIGESRERTERV